MVKLKYITESSWLVLSSDGFVDGLLSEQQEQYTLIVGKVKTIFNDRSEVTKFFSEDIFDTLIESYTPVEHFVNGYPVDFKTPYIATVESEYPLFTKTQTSKVLYSAGYFCVKFPKNWVTVYCPKLSTLGKYDHHGPYKLESELGPVLSKLRKCPK